MKKTGLFFVLLMGFLPMFSQTQAGLALEAKKMHDAHYTMDFDAIVALTHPAFFKSVSKETMAAKLDSDYQNSEFGQRLVYVTPKFEYSAIRKTDGKTLCVVRYKNPVRFFFENPIEETAAAKKTAAMKESMRAAKVTFEPKRNSIYADRVTILVAISDASTQGQWKFLNSDDAAQRAFIQTYLDAGTKKEIGL